MKISALLVDYGEVISEPQPAEKIEAMASLIGVAVAEFVDRYWRHRPAYDRGGSAATFWEEMLGTELVDAGTLTRLVELDMESWCVLRPSMLDLLRELRGRVHAMSILSNAPNELAAELRPHPALGFFDQMLFSAEIGAVKPEREAFDAAVACIGRPREEILFIDDRPDNVDGARAVGLRATLFTSVDGLRETLAA